MISVLLPENTAAPKVPAKPVRSDDASQRDSSSKNEFSALLPERSDQTDAKAPKADDAMSAGNAAAVTAPESPPNAEAILQGDVLAGPLNSAVIDAPAAEPNTPVTTTDPSDGTIKLGSDPDAIAAVQTATAAATEGAATIAGQNADQDRSPLSGPLAKDPRTRPAGETIEGDPRVQPNDRSSTDIAADATRGAATIAGQNADQDRSPLSGPLTAESVGRFSPDSDRASTAAEVDSIANTMRRDTIDADLVARADAQGRTTMAETSALDRAALPSVSREPAGMIADPLLPIAAASSGPTAQIAQGLTPIAPAIPVASPSELSSVILNAVKNGADGQEQLVVQLDPPELGRVTIDFKFDAQGLQQVVVTSENPEALKRLRELHFELTQALREQGLSDTNMSFQEHARDQSNFAQQDREGPGFSRPSLSSEMPSNSASATRERLQTAPRDRLDLLL